MKTTLALLCLAAPLHALQASVQTSGARSRSLPGVRLVVSEAADRSSARPLDGRTLAGDVFVFLRPPSQITSADFYLDDPDFLNAPSQSENLRPFDFAGTAPDGDAFPFDTASVTDGSHVISANVTLASGQLVELHGTFEVTNTLPQLLFPDAPPEVQLDVGGNTALSTTLTTDDGLPVGFALDENASWLEVSPVAGTTPAQIDLVIDTFGLVEGNYETLITATAPGYAPATQLVSLQVGEPFVCTPLPCGEILVDLPWVLDFESDHGKILDGAGAGTGFTYLDPPSAGAGYLPQNLELDTGAGRLRVTTTAGIQYQGTNSLDNALGVGVDAPSQVTEIRAVIVSPPAGTGSFEQAGLWFGNDEDDYVKLVVMSGGNGTVVQALYEAGGTASGNTTNNLGDLSGQTIELRLTVDPFAQSVTARYGVGAGATIQLASFAPSSELFSFDAAGINPEIGTRSFAGIFATHRNGPAPLVYEFEEFVVEEGEFTAPTGDFDFQRTSFPIDRPTSLVWGPDDRLYATSLLGEIRAFTLGPDNQVIDEEVITGLNDVYGSRLTLGITTDPASTANDVILYVAHSNSSLNNGAFNSGTVTRLSGPGFTVVEDVITGLPRALANHSVNSLHFGPDGRLYIAVGGNTGAGAPNLENTEFGDRGEQALSAAIVVADVSDPSFDGTCAPVGDPYGPAPCDVVPYATGLRNTYDFVFHSSGWVYAPDNGLGVTGTFPPQPFPDCSGLGDATPAGQGGHNPGTQTDPLNRIEPGKYYGHPNPARDECVFKDGSLQGVAPLPNWEPPFFDLGVHKSANGITEYPFDVGCADLSRDLLIVNYSSGDNVTRLRLAEDGLSVLDSSVFASGFSNPLPITVGADGTVFVGEYGGDVITALRPLSRGCWSFAAPRPAAVLDAAGAAVAGKLYAVGGKTSTNHVATLAAFDPIADAWTTLADRPGPAVENAAAVGLGGKLYVFGGSTGPFSGASALAHAYDPGTDTWSALAPMGTARGGPSASVLDGKIYVVGGMDGSGASLASAAVYDPVSDTWSPLPDMGTRRDNPASVALAGAVYVFGGRVREADGTTVDGTLNSVERFDPVAGSWEPRSPMPSGRRAMVAAVLDGKALVLGGERTGSGGAFDANEEYDPSADTWRILEPLPTPRHGAAGAAIGMTIYVTAGGDTGGSAFTTVNEAFAY